MYTVIYEHAVHSIKVLLCYSDCDDANSLNLLQTKSRIGYTTFDVGVYVCIHVLSELNYTHLSTLIIVTGHQDVENANLNIYA